MRKTALYVRYWEAIYSDVRPSIQVLVKLEAWVENMD